MSKMKIHAFVNFSSAQLTGDDFLGELSWRRGRKSLVEGQHKRRIDPGLSQGSEPLGQRSNQKRCIVWTKQAEGMRIKRDRDRFRLQCPGSFGDSGQYELMPAMHPVEIPDAGHSCAPVNRKFIQIVKYLHR